MHHVVPQIDLSIFDAIQELEITFANKIRFKTSIKAFVQYVLSLKNNLGKTVRGQVFQFLMRYKRADIDMVETMPTQEAVSTSPFSFENSMPPPPTPSATLPQQQPPQEVQPQPQRPADETLTQDQISRILVMLDERIVEAMKRELAGERLPVYIVDQDFVTLGWNPKKLEHARRAFRSEIRDASQYEVSKPARDLGVVGWAF
jgi:hypothetical protein